MLVKDIIRPIPGVRQVSLLRQRFTFTGSARYWDRHWVRLFWGDAMHGILRGAWPGVWFVRVGACLKGSFSLRSWLSDDRIAQRSPMQGYAPACRDEAFTGAREQFAQTEEWLAGEAAGLQHAELEEQLEVRGRELVRRLFQGHLDLLAAREDRRDDVAGEDGVVRTRAERGRTRPLVTRFGQVSVSRIAYRSPGRGNVHPLDAALNPPEESTPTGCASSPRSRRRAARWRRQGPRSPRRGRRDGRETAGRGAGPPLRRPCGGVLRAAGDRARAGGMAADPDFRREGHRDAARSAAPGHREGRGIRGGQARYPAVTGEKNGRKRMAELACVRTRSRSRAPPRMSSAPRRRNGGRGKRRPRPRRRRRSRGSRRPGASG